MISLGAGLPGVYGPFPPGGNQISINKISYHISIFWAVVNMVINPPVPRKSRDFLAF
jgi:hypothetical protein